MKTSQIPEEMTAVVLDTYEGVHALRVEKRNQLCVIRYTG